MVVHGRQDGCIHERYALAARSLLGAAAPTSSTVWLVDGAGHFAHLEQPDLVTDAVTSFLRRA
jgi:pimeloyl-ACP methyl ester carboxylesterase